jgi:hypothetical protein
MTDDTKPLVVSIDLRRLSEPTLRAFEADLLAHGDADLVWAVSEAIEAARAKAADEVTRAA